MPGLLEGCGAGGAGGLVGRCRSLECLETLPRVMAFHVLFPYQRQVCRSICVCVCICVCIYIYNL